MRFVAPVLSGLCWLSVLYGAVGILLSPSATVIVTAWPAHVRFEITAASAAFAVLAAVVSGLYAAGFLLAAGVARPALTVDPLGLAVFGIVALGAASAVQRPASLLSAAVVVGLSSAAVLCVWLLVALLWRGEAIEVESRWGGLGGGLGGFRLSRSASLALAALALVVACVAAVHPGPPPGDEAQALSFGRGSPPAGKDGTAAVDPAAGGRR